MDPPRRGTLQPVLDPHLNMRSGLPAPMSTVKRVTPAHFRQSMAGSSNMNPFLHSGPRQSMYPSQSLNVPPSASKAANPAFGRTPMRNSVHKGQQWASGRQSMVPPTPGTRHALKDPRNIRDKIVQGNMRSAIFAVLQDSQFDGPLNKQMLNSPTVKDFRAIFTHLAYSLDHAFIFAEEKGKFEDDVVLFLKAHQYPFADAVDKKWLATPSSPFSWPSLLAMLHWLTDHCKMKRNYLESGHPTLQTLEQVPENFEDPNHHAALAFEYCSDAYGVFLDGLDDFREPDQFIEDRYARKDASVLSELDTLKTELQTLTSEYARLTERPAPIVELEANIASVTTDKKKFEEYISHYENRKRKVVDSIAREDKDIAAETTNLQILREELERLSVVVKEQNLTPEEVAEMNGEQEKLNRILDELRRKSTETSNQMRSVEVSLAKRSENVEQAIDEYTDYLEKLGLFPKILPPLPPADIRLEINFASSNPRDLVRRVENGLGADLKKDIKNTLDTVAEYKRREHQSMEDELVTTEQDLDDVSEEAEKIEKEILEVERRISGLQEEAESIRNATHEEADMNNVEVERLRGELARARTAALANGRGVKSRLQALQIAYQEQIEKVDRLKDETVRMVLKSSSDIAAFKEEVSNHLLHLRQYAEEN